MIHGLLALALFKKARLAKEEGKLGVCVDLLKESASVDEHYKTYELLGECLESQEDLTNANEAYSRAMVLNPGANKSGYLLARSLAMLGRKEEAKRILIDVLGTNPTYGPAKKYLAELS